MSRGPGDSAIPLSRACKASGLVQRCLRGLVKNEVFIGKTLPPGYGAPRPETYGTQGGCAWAMRPQPPSGQHR